MPAHRRSVDSAVAVLDSVDQRIAELEYLVGVTEGNPTGIAQDQAAPWLLNRALPGCRSSSELAEMVWIATPGVRRRG